jgi:hypothetical protein
MWLLDRLCPDHKSIAEFRRRHREAITASGSEFVRLARSVSLIRGEWIPLTPGHVVKQKSAEEIACNLAS